MRFLLTVDREGLVVDYEGLRPTHTAFRPARTTPSDLLCLDVGSTFTKAVLVGADGEVRGTAETLTTRRTDVLDGCRVLAEELGAGDERRRSPVPARAADCGWRWSGTSGR